LQVKILPYATLNIKKRLNGTQGESLNADLTERIFLSKKKLRSRYAVSAKMKTVLCTNKHDIAMKTMRAQAPSLAKDC
jgi:hypothetical protein